MRRVPFLALILLILATAPLSAVTFGEPVQVDFARAADVALAYAGEHVLAAWVDTGGVVRIKATDRPGEGFAVGEPAVSVAVAAIGDFGLVVWTEPSGDVFARRVDGQGAPVAAAVRAGFAANSLSRVSVAASGDRYLILWSDPGRHIYATVLNANGEIQVVATVVALSATQARDPQVTSNGTGFAAVWSTPAEKRVFTLMFDRYGRPSASEPLLVSDGAELPDIASDGSEYLIAWTDNPTDANAARLLVRTLTPPGELGRIIELAVRGSAPQLAWDGSTYLLVRLLYYYDGFGRVQVKIPVLFAHRFRSSGALVDVDVTSPMYSAMDSAYVSDVIARSGRVDLIGAGDHGVIVKTALLASSRRRARATRH